MHARPRLASAALITATFLFASALSTPPARGVTLGGELVESALGQPLVASFRLRGVNEALSDASCIRLGTSAAGDGLPQVTQGSLTLERRQGEPWLVLRSPRPVMEPVVRVSLIADCDGVSRRDYVLLLDPPVAIVGPGRDGVVERTRPAVADAPAFAAGSSAPTTPSAAAPAAPVGARAEASMDSLVRRPARRASASAAPAMAAATPPAPRTDPGTRATAPRVKRDRLRIDQPARSLHVIDDAALAALAVPRLRLTPEIGLVAESGAPSGGSVFANDPLQKALADARRARLREAPIDEDLAPRIEADLIVAKRKIEELQAQLAARGSAPAVPADAAARKTATPEAQPQWDWFGTGLPALLGAGAVALLLGLLWLRRRRHTEHKTFELGAKHAETDETVEDTPPVDTRATVAGRSPALATTSGASLAAVGVDELRAPVREATPATERAAPEPPRPIGATSVMSSVPSTPSLSLAPPSSLPVEKTPGASAASYQVNTSDVDVQELSHVTEEAQVYVEVGRIDQAIALLKSHVEAHEGSRPSPAPWLMLLDLYRRAGNRDAYDELAPRFQQRFNGRMPAWDNYGHELALDDGLEAFPHLVSRISRGWRTPRARALLEELLYDNRGGSRLGFSLAAYRDILLLLQIHDAVTQGGGENSWSLEPPAGNPDDGTPKWTLDLDTVDDASDSKLGQWLNRPQEG